MNKICKKCNILKSLESFSTNNRLKGGKENSCKECKSISFKNWYIKNNPPKEKRPLSDEEILAKRESIKQYKQNYYQVNKKSIIEKQKVYIQENYDTIKNRQISYRNKNKELINKRSLEGYHRHKEKNKEKRKLYAKKHSDRHKKYLKQDKLKNSHVYNSYNAKRRAIKKSQLHPETNPILEKILYEKAKRLTICTGIPYVVDHVIPLVSGGPHHHLNLQVIPNQINLKKKDNINFTHPNILTANDIPNHIKNFKLDFSFSNDTVEL